jgi:hypothetical protein
VEFEFILMGPQYVFAMAVGIVGGLAQRLGYWQRDSRRLAPVATRRLADTAGAAMRSLGS